jgi:hypothetical protein
MEAANNSGDHMGAPEYPPDGEASIFRDRHDSYLKEREAAKENLLSMHRSLTERLRTVETELEEIFDMVMDPKRKKWRQGASKRGPGRPPGSKNVKSAGKKEQPKTLDNLSLEEDTLNSRVLT